jgi:hypothetical protein
LHLRVYFPGQTGRTNESGGCHPVWIEAYKINGREACNDPCRDAIIIVVDRRLPVRSFVKIALTLLLGLLIVFAVVADLPIGQKLGPLLGLGLYLKLISLLGMLTLALFAWGHKHRIEASQKYRRADEALKQAEATLERKRQVCEQMEQQLKETYQKKEQGLDDQIEQVRMECQQRLNALKAQNIELKETMAKLMNTLKRQNQQRS